MPDIEITENIAQVQRELALIPEQVETIIPRALRDAANAAVRASRTELRRHVAESRHVQSRIRPSKSRPGTVYFLSNDMPLDHLKDRNLHGGSTFAIGRRGQPRAEHDYPPRPTFRVVGFTTGEGVNGPVKKPIIRRVEVNIEGFQGAALERGMDVGETALYSAIEKRLEERFGS